MTEGWVQKHFGKKVYFRGDMRVSKIYFSDKELACKGSGVVKLNPIFDEKLTRLRQNFNEPMTVNSCCRSKEHNDKVGGSPRSFHLYDNSGRETNGTCAIDIKRKGGTYDLKFILDAWDANWSIGVHPSFFHIDCRTDVLGMKQVMFSYGKTDPHELAKFRKLVA